MILIEKKDDSDSVCEGSNPSPAANVKRPETIENKWFPVFCFC